MHTTDLPEGHLHKKMIDFYWKEIWDRFQKGDMDAFEILYNEHVDFLFSYGIKITRNANLVEDAIQDLFLYLLSKKENLASPQFIQYYLIRAFKRVLMTRLREEGAYVADSGEEGFSFNFTVDIDDTTNQQVKEKKLELIESLVEQLDPGKKEILFLKFHSGLSYKEIGNLVGMQPDSAKKIVYRTVTSLREIIQKKVFELFFLFTTRSHH